MKPLTKLSRQIVSASSIPTVVRDAFRVATEERPGPVHLELPEDVAGEMTVPVGPGAAAPGRPAGGQLRGAATGRRSDQPGGTAAGDARRGGQPPTVG